MPQFSLGNILVASVIAAFLGITSFVYAPIIMDSETKIYLTPSSGLLTVGEEFVVNVKVDSHIPVNVFSGLIKFNNQTLAVEKIDYNTSIADLWAVEPWYNSGAGTLEFAGGTTKTGGFVGSDTLITITFKTQNPGEATLSLTDTRMIQHDGLGTDVNLVDHPIDALFTITPEKLNEITIETPAPLDSKLIVVENIPSADLNNDGQQNFTDMSIFMTYFARQDLRVDFNVDGKVGLPDLSIIMQK